MALRASIEANPFDELIQLKDQAQCKEPPRAKPGTRVVLYTNAEDIPALVCSGTVQPAEQLRSDLEAAPELDEDDVDDAQEEDTAIEHVDIEEATRAADAALSYEPPPPPTEDQVAAALVFTNLYRRRLRARRRHVPKKGLAEHIAKWFEACREILASRKMSPGYRLLYLGPLPHALACLDSLRKQDAALAWNGEHGERALFFRIQALLRCRQIL